MKSITMDLTKGKPAFDMKNDMSIATREHFERRIKTNYVEEYFHYANVIEEEDEDEIEPYETVLDKYFQEYMKEHNALTASFEDKTLKTLFKDRFHQIKTMKYVIYEYRTMA